MVRKQTIPFQIKRLNESFSNRLNPRIRVRSTSWLRLLRPTSTRGLMKSASTGVDPASATSPSPGLPSWRRLRRRSCRLSNLWMLRVFEEINSTLRKARVKFFEQSFCIQLIKIWTIFVVLITVARSAIHCRRSYHCLVWLSCSSVCQVPIQFINSNHLRWMFCLNMIHQYFDVPWLASGSFSAVN